MNQKRFSRIGFLLVMVCCAAAAPAADAPAKTSFALASCFSDHMVLQSGRAVPVWGSAAPGETVTVTIGSQTKTGTAGADGKWSVQLDPLTPGEALTLSAQGTGGKPARVVKDVLAGEVWLCSGQSNMALPVSKAMDYEKEKAAADLPQIRMFNGKWIVCNPQTVGAFSAVAYYFGREIHAKTGAPVGLLNLSSGGTPIELWTSLEAQKAVPELKPILQQNGQAALASKEDAEQAKSDREQAVEVEGKKAVNTAKVTPGLLFHKRIEPMAPYGIRGVIWYQGEANSYTVHANLYGVQLATMIKEWRRLWGYDFLFLTVQLPGFGAPQAAPVEECGRALVREGVLNTLKGVTSTGMAVTADIGDEKSNHPLNKQEVGRRLAQWALATAYEKKDVVASGPLPAECKIGGGRVSVTFRYADGGLAARGGGELKGFAIAGKDGKWVWAKAKIEGDTVVVSCPEVKSPAAVRYAWASNPIGSNLVNGAGLPASPFRTDGEPLSAAGGR